MRLVERHIIKTNHQFYKEIDDLAWRSKNLYNYANYLVRQSFLINEESYTSISLFLDLDPIPVYKKGEKPTFSGKRVKRAWYRSSDGRFIHADINASLNITRKVVPATFSSGIEGIAVYPFRVTPGKVA